jgi:hypothetical protein
VAQGSIAAILKALPSSSGSRATVATRSASPFVRALSQRVGTASAQRAAPLRPASVLAVPSVPVSASSLADVAPAVWSRMGAGKAFR